MLCSSAVHILQDSLLTKVLWRAEAEQDMHGLTAPRPGKPEARSHRRPHTARPAEGSEFHEEHYKRASAPYVGVEWEDSPSTGTKVWLRSTGCFELLVLPEQKGIWFDCGAFPLLHGLSIDKLLSKGRFCSQKIDNSFQRF